MSQVRSVGSRRVTKVTLVLMTLVIIGVAAGFYTVSTIQHNTPKLAGYTESRLANHVKKKTGLNIAEVKIDKKTGLVSVSYLEDNLYDENGAVYVIARDAKAIMPLLFEIEGVKKVKVVELGTFVDDQGNSNVETSVSIVVKKSRAEEIDWDAVNTENKAELISYASELYINPAIKAEITNEDILRSIVTQLEMN